MPSISGGGAANPEVVVACALTMSAGGRLEQNWRKRMDRVVSPCRRDLQSIHLLGLSLRTNPFMKGALYVMV